MRPARSTANLRIDPAYPLLWRDDDTVQFGLEGAAVITLSSDWQLSLIDELLRGIRRSSFDVVAHMLGAPRDEARALLNQLNPVLHLQPLRPPSVHVTADDCDDEPGALWLASLLRDAGCAVLPADYPGVIHVRVVRGSAVASRFVAELSADRAHLPVAFDLGGAVIGPLVVPGRTPCLGCRDHQATASDPAWPRLHAQLVGRAGGRVSSPRTAQAAPLVLELLRDANPGMRAVRLAHDGVRTWHPISFSEVCGCRALPHEAPREIATAPARELPTDVATTTPAFAQPA